MKIIHRERRTGKTSELIRMASESDGYIVTINGSAAEGILEIANGVGLDINFPITFHSFISGNYPKGIKSFLFDELGLSLQSITEVPIEAITISDEKQNT